MSVHDATDLGARMSNTAAVRSYAPVIMTAGSIETRAADLVVISTNSTKEALVDLLPLFERSSGHKVEIAFGSGPSLVARIKSGLAGDLFVGPAEFADDLERDGKLIAGSRVPFVRSGSGVAVRAGAPKPDVSTPESFKAALLAAKSVSFSAGISGIKFVEVLARLGIADEVARKKVAPQPGELVGAVVARGAAEIGVQQLSELLPVAGIEILGPLPGDLQDVNIYGVSVMTVSRQPDAGRAFVRFLRSDVAAPVFKHKGMAPL